MDRCAPSSSPAGGGTRPAAPPRARCDAKRCLVRIAASFLCWNVVAIGYGLTLSAADTGWDVAPYQITIWLALEPQPEVIDGWSARLPREIERVTEIRCGSAWQLDIQSAPVSIGTRLLDAFDSVSDEDIETADAEALAGDKLFLVAVRSTLAGFVTQVREVDARTRYSGPILTRHVDQPPRVGNAVSQSIMTAFAPIGLISRVRDDVALVRMRARMLAVDPDSPLAIADGHVLRPIMRKNDRLGQPVPDGVEPIPWTLLRVTGSSPGGIQCEMISGLRSPMRTRSSRRIERLALAVVPHYESTEIRLHDLRDPSVSLSGYDLYSRLPGEKTSTLVGRTDWRGRVTLPRDEHLIKTLYVKHGGKLLARLPMVPGYEPLLQAAVNDDSLRLEAEGFLRGLQEEIVDLVARRTILKLRIEQRLDDGRVDEAAELLDEMRSLPTREELDRRVRDRQQSLISDNRVIQDKIDRMFRQTNAILRKHLNPDEIEELQRAISAARSTASK